MNDTPSAPNANVNPAPPPPGGPRFVGDPFAGLPQEVRARLARDRSSRSLPPGAPKDAGTVPTGAVWGTGGASIDTAYGTILSASIKRSSEKEKYPDNNGETVAYIFYDAKSGGSFECLIAGTLDVGDTIAIGGKTLVVDDAEQQWEYKGWSKYRVNAEKHDGVTIA